MADDIQTATGTAYATFCKVSITLLTKFGTTGTILRAVPAGEYDPATGRIPQGAPEQYTFTGIASSWTWNRQPVTPAIAGAQRIILDAQTLAIRPNMLTDTITFLGVRLRMVPNGSKVVQPSGVPIIYDLECVGVEMSKYIPSGDQPASV